ncbi:hypothetical protein [Streptomyces sp. f150]|uniref:hypothetical protein n=1 Tax=Streptomyces sp. f150 TaxID=1827699 RepID=UPI0015CF7832|nr:hypothetical protein [Streptomyces sp. f150]
MLADRPEREVIGSENLQNGLHHHHLRMMPDPLIRRHGLSVAAERRAGRRTAVEVLRPVQPFAPPDAGIASGPSVILRVISTGAAPSASRPSSQRIFFA